MDDHEKKAGGSPPPSPPRSVERTERYYRWLLERQDSGTLAQNPYLVSGGRIDPFAEPEEKENGKRTEGLTEEASESGRF